MTRKALILIATFGSVALIFGALGFEHIGNMPPCKLCHWQRYGHYAAIAIGAIAAFLGLRILALLGAAGALWSAAIGGYHSGVERGWWDGPKSCSSISVEGLTPAEAMEKIMNAPLVRCDDVQWDMLGLSMASWNMLASLVLFAIWMAAALKKA